MSTLSVLNNTAGAYQFALPLEEWGQRDAEVDLWWAKTSLLLLQVDTNSGQAKLMTNKKKRWILGYLCGTETVKYIKQHPYN